ncbi:MAG: hypothetical protein ACE5GY_07920 [Thermodesulfobacteriota bacterium]
MDDAVGEVNIPPLECQQLTSSEPGKDGRKEEGVEFGAYLPQKETDLFRGEEVHVLLFYSRLFHVHGRVLPEVSPANRMLEHLLQGDKVVADGLGRELRHRLTILVFLFFGELP